MTRLFMTGRGTLPYRRRKRKPERPTPLRTKRYSRGGDSGSRLFSMRDLPPRGSVTSGIADREPRGLELEERREDRGRRKLQGLGQLVRRERVLAPESFVETRGLVRHLEGQLRLDGARRRNADRREELRQHVL